MWAPAGRVLKAVVRALVRDRGLGQAITYHRVLSLEFDPASQTTTPSYETTSLRAIIGPQSCQGFGPGKKSLRFVVAQSDFSVSPKPGDRLEWAGMEFRVKTVEADRAEAIYKLEVEPG